VSALEVARDEQLVIRLAEIEIIPVGDRTSEQQAEFEALAVMAQAPRQARAVPEVPQVLVSPVAAPEVAPSVESREVADTSMETDASIETAAAVAASGSAEPMSDVGGAKDVEDTTGTSL